VKRPYNGLFSGIAILLTVTSALAEQATAQSLGGEITRGAVEVGWITQTINRDLSDALGGSFAMSWGRGALLVTFAPHDRIQIAFGGAVWYDGASDRFPTRRYRRSNVGLAGRARLWRRGRSQVGVAAGAHYALDFDESPSQYHKRENRFFGALVGNQGFIVARPEASVWIAPAYVRDAMYQYPPRAPVQELHSKGDFALVLGGDALLAHHVRPYLQATFTRRWGSEFGLGYRF
jgi:hypothetical protein